MHFLVLTLFPEKVSEAAHFSLLGKAIDSGKIKLETLQIRDFADPPHFRVDDAPFGGGEGMVLRFDILHRAWEAAIKKFESRPKTIFLSPQGPLLTQSKAKELNKFQNLLLVCGHYEGIDERFIEACVDEELSIGDYILSGGELAALVVIDVISRLKDGVIGNEDSVKNESFETDGLLKYAQYTRPSEHLGKAVPPWLLSGNHAEIRKKRSEDQIRRTALKRPDLVKK